MMITQKIFFSGVKFLFTIRSITAKTGSKIAIPINIKAKRLNPNHIVEIFRIVKVRSTLLIATKDRIRN